MAIRKILLGQLANYGDCLYATAIARQIKTDYPSCRLTWAIGSLCRSILDGNPHVDEIWEIPLTRNEDVAKVWQEFEREARLRKKRGDFDAIFFTQIAPNNFQNYDGTVRASIFRGYPRPITVPVAPVMRLSDREIQNVRNFAQTHNLNKSSNVVLFECSSRSGQSFVTPQYAFEVSRRLIQEIPDLQIILSHHTAIPGTLPRLIDGSVLSFRENAELTKYCSLLIGCSSGISWLCTSDWAKPLPMVQLLKKETSVYASFVHDYEYRKESTDTIIEMTDCPPDKLIQCVTTIIQEGFTVARSRYHEQIPLTFDFYCKVLSSTLLRMHFHKTFLSLWVTVRRYGLQMNLIQAIFRQIFQGFKIIFSKLCKK